MRSSGNTGSSERNPDRTQAHNPQCNGGHCPHRLYIVGIGPGHPDHLTQRAKDVLSQVERMCEQLEAHAAEVAARFPAPGELVADDFIESFAGNVAAFGGLLVDVLGAEPLERV